METLLFLWLQTIGAFSARLPFTTYSVDEGLVQSVVYAVHQDRQGYLWAGTQAGLSRFDGQEFVSLTSADGLMHNVVRTIYECRDGRLLFGTEAGIDVYQDETFRPLVDDAMMPRSVRTLVESQDGTIWGGSYGDGLFTWRDGRLTLLTRDMDPEFHKVRAIMEDREGRIWVGFHGGGVAFYEKGIPHFIDMNDHRDAPFVRSFFQQEDGSILIGTYKGLYRYADDKITRHTPHENLARTVITDMARNKQGELVLGTSRYGAAIINAKKEVRFLGMEQGMPSNGINCLLLDDEGMMWFGTYGGGLSRLVATNILNYSDQHGFSHTNVYTIYEDRRNRIWFGTNGGGVSILEGERFTQLTRRDGLADNKVLCIAETRDGQMMFGTLSGISLYRDGAFVGRIRTDDGLPHNTVYTIVQTRDGRIWAGTYEGLFIIDEKSGNRVSDYPALRGQRITHMLEDRAGTLWIGTEKGIAYYRDGAFGSLGTQDGLPGIFINYMMEDSRGNLWIAGAQGLSRYRDGQFENFGVEDGLSSSICNVVLEDEHGTLYIGTNRGITRYDGTSFSYLSKRDGLVSNEINRSSGHRDRSGNLWFGTIKGVSRFRAAENRPGTRPPHIHLTHFDVLGQEHPRDQRIALDHHQNYVRFSYTGISFTDAGNINFAYRLEGLDKDWNLTRSRNAVYHSLPPGSYVFRVKGRIGDGEWRSTSPLPFEVRPPFWLKPWFLTLVGLLLVGFVVQRIRRLGSHNRFLRKQVEAERAIQLLREAEIRLLHSQMNPHFLQNALTNAIYYAPKNAMKTEKILRKLSQVLHHAFQASHKGWTPLREEKQLIDSYMEIQKLRFGDCLHYSMTCPEHLLELKIPSFIVQPLVENAVVHGLKTVGTVSINWSCHEEDDMVCMEVTNSGQPMHKSFEQCLSPDHALGNINKRLLLLFNRELSYHYEEGNHHFYFSFPVKSEGDTGEFKAAAPEN